MAKTMTLRLSDELAADVALVARLDGISGAETTRRALAEHVETRLSDASLRERLEQAHEADRRRLSRPASIEGKAGRRAAGER